MAWKTKPSRTTSAAGSDAPADKNDARAMEAVNLLDRVGKHLQQGHADKALEAIARSRLQSPQLANANAVCLLRLGRTKEAVDLLRGLVLAPGGMTLRIDVPLMFKTNFATALLTHDNLEGCLNVLHEINDEDNPAVQQLRNAIQRFRAGLSLWKKMWWRLGLVPNGQVPIDFPAGNLA
jgi:hypothetical protein